ncbi:putative ATPase/DNA-binding SARP family transcriptional activator [Spinactinospora alkalitolerans]|uniref:Putative ATPase/DNA-binding SARP family transcriptional activator n=1 Tax=Spinactinospora alkalitolerans TaxID=687207 RepID=A0A852TTU8_9ACTN|nr:putative ATPase/DNA-binding SARP family transcriptional activator [Spinactinospora alkalitolerans]
MTVYDGAGRTVPVGGARLRALLVLLLLEPGRTVGAERLIDGIWDDGATVPADASNALQALVSRLRRTLGAGAPVLGEATGYRLDVTRDRIDLWEFEDLVGFGRRARSHGDLRGAVRAFDGALALWRGPALADISAAPAGAGAALRLAGLRRAVTEERLALHLDLGRHREVLPDIEALAVQEPLREQPAGLLMRALAASGRKAEALAVYDRLRRELSDELGIDPSGELGDLHLRLLRGELDAAGPDRPPGPGKPALDGGAAPVLRLPPLLTSFIGRDGEVGAAVELLSGQRLVTLTGPGGAGKTRLSIRSGADFAECHPGLAADGVWFVELAPLTEAAEIPHTVMATLGLRERSLIGIRGGASVPAGDPVTRICEALAGQDVLIVLDNCEHVVAAAAGFAARLLAACPGVRILATSREPLGVPGERLLPVPSLEPPPKGATAAQALDCASVRLFAERAEAVAPGFTVHDGNVDHVVRVCRELDGMPLALELAAARLRAMPVAQLAARLSDRFRLLTSGSRLALPRHQTLQAVIDWSWELLDDAERTLLRRLAVFAGGATLEAVERVCADVAGEGGVGGRDVWPVLFALVDKSLVVAEEPQNGEGQAPRYRMLETIRAYGAQRLAESGEAEALRRAHAEDVLRLWRLADPMLRTGEQLGWLALLRVENDNLTAALRWAVDRRDTALALDLSHAAQWYWQMTDGCSEACRWSGEIAALAGDRPPEGRAVAYAECVAAIAIGDDTGASTAAELDRALRILTEAGEAAEDHPNLILVPTCLALVQGDPRAGMERIAAWTGHADPWLRATATSFEGMMALQAGLADRALARLTRAVELFRRIGDRWGTAQSLTSLSEIVRFTDPAAEQALLQEGAQIAEEMAFADLLRMFHVRLAGAAAVRGDIEEARGHIATARTPMRGGAGVEQPMRLIVDFAEAEVDRRAGELGRAERGLTSLLSEIRLLGIVARPQLSAMWNWELGRIALDARRWDAARRYLATAWDAARDGRDAPSCGGVLDGLAELALTDGDPERGARLLGHAEAVRGLPNQVDPEVARLRALLCERLGEEGFAQAYARGAAAGTGGITESVDAWIAAWPREDL